MITAEAIKNLLLGTNAKEHTLTKLVEYHNTKYTDTLAPGTLKNYHTTARYIQRFLKERIGTTDMFLSKLTYKFITDFEFYLRNYKPIDHQRPLSNNGVMKYLERLRKLVAIPVLPMWI